MKKTFIISDILIISLLACCMVYFCDTSFKTGVKVLLTVGLVILYIHTLIRKGEKAPAPRLRRIQRGADLILTKGRTKTIVQAKRYRNSVGEAAVQQAIAAMGYYKADQCMVVTNSDFTPAARELAKKTEVVLIDRNKLGKSAMYI